MVYLFARHLLHHVVVGDETDHGKRSFDRVVDDNLYGEEKRVKDGDARTARGRTCIRCLTRSFFVHFHEKFLRALLVQIDDEEISLAQIRLAVDARWRARI